MWPWPRSLGLAPLVSADVAGGVAYVCWIRAWRVVGVEGGGQGGEAIGQGECGSAVRWVAGHARVTGACVRRWAAGVTRTRGSFRATRLFRSRDRLHRFGSQRPGRKVPGRLRVRPHSQAGLIRLASWLVISTVRGLAASLTGMARVSTPAV